MPSIHRALQAAIDEHGGHLPFDRFMQIALHHPDGGYYASNIRGIGGGGDFTTAPKLTRALGRSITAWLRAEAARRRWKSFHIIECGPGDGSLAADIMRTFGWLERRRVTLHLVETSAPLRERQKAALRGFNLRWHNDIGNALAECDGCALIFHNEFLDAFPCRVFRKEGIGWKELHLKVREKRLTGVFLLPSRALPHSAAFIIDWPEGQQIEVFEATREWMQTMATHWREGAMLAIDYGAAAESVYHRRPHGTLRAYRNHERLEGDAVCEMPGLQDITADVNFSDVSTWARDLGWRRTLDRSLAEFLGQDIDTRLRDAGNAIRCMAFVTVGAP